MPGLQVALQVVQPFGQRGVGGGDVWVAAGDHSPGGPSQDFSVSDFGRAAVLGQAEDARAVVKAVRGFRMIVAPLSLVLIKQRDPDQPDSHTKRAGFKFEFDLGWPPARWAPFICFPRSHKPA